MGDIMTSWLLKARPIALRIDDSATMGPEKFRGSDGGVYVLAPMSGLDDAEASDPVHLVSLPRMWPDPCEYALRAGSRAGRPTMACIRYT